jgi:hypothetical protein
MPNKIKPVSETKEGHFEFSLDKFGKLRASRLQFTTPQKTKQDPLQQSASSRKSPKKKKDKERVRVCEAANLRKLTKKSLIIRICNKKCKPSRNVSSELRCK